MYNIIAYVNKPFNETVFKFLNDSSFVVYLANGFWIYMVLLQLIDHKDIENKTNLDAWYNNYYICATTAMVMSEIMCFVTHLSTYQLSRTISDLKGLLKSNTKGN